MIRTNRILMLLPFGLALTGCPGADDVQGTAEGSSGGEDTMTPVTTAVTTVNPTTGDPDSTGNADSTGDPLTTGMPDTTSGPDTTGDGSGDTAGATDTGMATGSGSDSGTAGTTDPTSGGTTEGGTTTGGTTGGGTTSGGSSTGGSTGTTGGTPEVGFGNCAVDDMACLPDETCIVDFTQAITTGACARSGCVDVGDCPAQPDGGAAPTECSDISGDAALDCWIDCSSDDACPTGMGCFLNTICLWPDDIDYGSVLCEEAAMGCTDDDPCACIGCNDNGICGVDDDCVCADCLGDVACGGGLDDGICNPYQEDCLVADCFAHPECLIADIGFCVDDSIGATPTLFNAAGNTLGTIDDFVPSCQTDDSEDYVVHWTPTVSGTFVIDTEGSTLDTILTVLADCGGVELACDDDSGTGTTSLLSFDADAGTTYLIVIDGYNGTTGAFDLSITLQ